MQPSEAAIPKWQELHCRVPAHRGCVSSLYSEHIFNWKTCVSPDLFPSISYFWLLSISPLVEVIVSKWKDQSTMKCVSLTQLACFLRSSNCRFFKHTTSFFYGSFIKPDLCSSQCLKSASPNFTTVLKA